MRSPHWHRMVLVGVSIVFALTLVAPTPLRASTILFTFAAPQFAPLESTPLLGKAPNVGDPSFTTDFTSAPTADGFDIAPNILANPLISGPSLFDVFGPADVLSLAFSSPIFSLTVDFAVNAPQGAMAGLALVTPVGSTAQLSSNLGGTFPGGTLEFNSAVSFSTAQLSGFGGRGGGAALFAIDNLALSTTPVPEPGTLTFLSTGAVAAFLRRRRRARAHPSSSRP